MPRPKSDWAMKLINLEKGQEVIIEPKGIAEKTLRNYLYGILAKKENKKFSIQKIYKVTRTL